MAGDLIVADEGDETRDVVGHPPYGLENSPLIPVFAYAKNGPTQIIATGRRWSPFEEWEILGEDGVPLVSKKERRQLFAVQGKTQSVKQWEIIAKKEGEDKTQMVVAGSGSEDYGWKRVVVLSPEPVQLGGPCRAGVYIISEPLLTASEQQKLADSTSPCPIPSIVADIVVEMSPHVAKHDIQTALNRFHINYDGTEEKDQLISRFIRISI